MSSDRLFDTAKLIVISGPCIIENEEHALLCARFLKNLFSNYESDIHFIFKASYDKANRSSLNSFRGPGLSKGLSILETIKNDLNIPILTDVHSPEEAEAAGQICDYIQIPAFLCRQTDLLLAAGRSGAFVNVKKGQFISPWEMSNIVEKISSTGNNNIILTERGFSFGYNNLICDMRSIDVMKRLGYPVIFDGSHSVQLPGALKTQSGGQREFIPTLTNASLGAGCDGLFIESHPEPEKALSDSASVLNFSALPDLISTWINLYKAVRKTPTSCFHD